MDGSNTTGKKDRVNRKRLSSRWFGPHHRRSATIALAIITLLVGASWMTRRSMRDQAERDVAKSLEQALVDTHSAVKRWTAEQRHAGEVWARQKTLRDLSQQLVALADHPQELRQASASREVAAMLEPLVQSREFLDYMVVSPAGTIVAASASDKISQVLDRALLESLLARAALGDSMVVLPSIESASDSTNTPSHVALPPGLVGAPILDDEQALVAMLVFGLNLESRFTATLARGQIGGTGETYAFDAHGRMLSASRFGEFVQRAGLLPRGKSTIATLEIRDPGFDLTRLAIEGTGDHPLEWTEMAQSALKGQAGRNVQGYRTYYGVMVAGAWLWDPALNVGFASEVDIAEAYAPLAANLNALALLTGVSVVLVVAMAGLFIFSREQIIRSEQKYRQLFEHSPDGLLIVGNGGSIRQVNQAAVELFGYARHDLEKLSIESLLPHHSAPLNKVQSDLVMMGRKRDGTEFPIDLTCCATRLAQEHVLTATVRDISGLKRAEHALRELERKNRLLKDVALAANAADQVSAVMEVALRRIAEYVNWPVGHAYEVVEPGSLGAAPYLRSLRCWYLRESGPFSAFVETTQTSELALGEELPGRVWENGQPVWMVDVQEERYFPRQKAARACAMRATFAFAVRVGGKVTVVLEFFSIRQESANFDVLELTAQVGEVLAVALTRLRSAQDLQHRAAELEARTLALQAANENSKAARANSAS